MAARRTPYLFYIRPEDFYHVDGDGRLDPFARTRFDRLMVESDRYRQFAFLPHSGLKVIIEEDSLYWELEGTRAVQRLEGISQLGIIISEMGYATGARNYTRFLHSLTVAFLMETMLTRWRFPREKFDLAITAGFLHDAAMPPYSDQGKLAALADMDEEKNIGMLLTDSDLQAIFRKHRLRDRDILACIRGTYPVIGQLLNGRDNIDADRIAYVACDSHFLGISDEMAHYRKENLFDIYRDARLIDGRIAYRDAERVKDFLFLRALLFHDFYCGQGTRGRETLMTQALATLWKRGLISQNGLLAMRDDDLEKMVLEHLPRAVHDHLFLVGFSEVAEAARIREGSVEEVRARFPEPEYLVEEQRTFKPLTGALVRTRRGIRSFKEINPDAAKELEALVQDRVYVGVYAVPKEVQDALREIWEPSGKK